MGLKTILDTASNRVFDGIDRVSDVYVRFVPKPVRFVIHPLWVIAVVIACIPIYLIGMFVIGVCDTWKKFD